MGIDESMLCFNYINLPRVTLFSINPKVTQVDIFPIPTLTTSIFIITAAIFLLLLTFIEHLPRARAHSNST